MFYSNAREDEPSLREFISSFWWNYGSAKHYQYPLDQPPYSGKLIPQDWQRMKSFYGAKPIRVELTFSGLWGSYLAATKRYFNSRLAFDKQDREIHQKRILLCNELIERGFPAKHIDHAPRHLLATQFYYERLFLLQWRYNMQWDDPDFRASMVALRDITKSIYLGELHDIPKPYADFR